MRKALRGTVILTGVSVVMGVFLCEILLRIFRPVRIVGLSRQPFIYETNETTGYAFIRNAEGRIHRNFEMDNLVRINSDGFHDIERDPRRRRGRPRIAVIGDSFTASIHVPVSATWTQVLERQLRRLADPSPEVINLGLVGTGTDVQLDILSSYLRNNDVDAVILAFYANDINDMQLRRPYREVYGEYVIVYQNSEQRDSIISYIDNEGPPPLIRALYERSFVFRALMYAAKRQAFLNNNFVTPYRAGNKEPLRYDTEAMPSRIGSVFARLTGLSRTKGFSLYVIPVPAKDDPARSMDTLASNIPAELKGKLKMVDVAAPLRVFLGRYGYDYSRLFWKYDDHFNVEGNRAFGLLVAGFLQQDIGLCQKASPDKEAVWKLSSRN